MKNNHVHDQLSAYLDQALSADENKRIETHLRDCADCRRVFEELKGVVHWMKSVPKPLPRAGLETRMLVRLAGEESRGGFRRAWLPLSGGLATALVALLVFVMVRENHREIIICDGPEYERKSESRADANYAEKNLAKEPPLERQKAESKIASGVAGKYSDNQFPVQATAPQISKAQEKNISADVEGWAKKINGAQGRRAVSAGASAQEESESLAALDSVALRSNVVEKAEPGISGWNCDITKPEQQVIRTRDELNSLLKRMGPQAPAAAFSSIDFSKQMIIAVFMGGQPTAGFSIHIVSEEFRKDPKGQTLLIGVWKTSPPKDAYVAMVITQPYHLKVIPLFPGPVQFEEVK